MSKHIKTHNTRAEDTQPDDTNFDWYFPVFVFALRDFALEKRINGQEVTSEEYMEHCLRLKEGSDDRTRKYNESRLCIR